MSLVTQLTDYINAAFSGLWVTTVEPDEAERELVEHARRNMWTLAVWDIARGLRFPTNALATVPDVNDPLSVLKALTTLAPTTVSTRSGVAGSEHTTRPMSEPTSRVNVGRPVSLPSAFAKALLPVPGTRSSKTPRGRTPARRTP